MNSESVSGWIGQTIKMRERVGGGIAVERRYKLGQLIAVGEHDAVFDVEGRWVVKFPKTHLGFLINLPPDEHFPDCANDEVYSRRFVSRIRALQCSPFLGLVHPLEELWTGLAVQHLARRDRSAQTI